MAERQIDDLSLLFGSDYQINNKLVVHQPTLNDIHNIGEETYFANIYTMTAIPFDMKYPLHVIGVDYEQLSDFELFINISRNIDDSVSYSVRYGRLFPNLRDSRNAFAERNF